MFLSLTDTFQRLEADDCYNTFPIKDTNDSASQCKSQYVCNNFRFATTFSQFDTMTVGTSRRSNLERDFFLYLIENHAVSLQQYFFVLIVWVEVRVLWQQLILHVGCPALSEPWEIICFLQPVNRIVAAVFKILYVTMHLHRYKGRLLDWPKTGILPTIPEHFQWYKKRENRRSTSKTWWGLGDWAWFIAGGGVALEDFGAVTIKFTWSTP